jgi:ABC-type sugar transport system ATPase subunit
MNADLVLRLSRVRKQYNALRPLRLNDLSIAAGERVSLSGLDAGAAEVLVNLVTGASVPDEGWRLWTASASSARARFCSIP